MTKLPIIFVLLFVSSNGYSGEWDNLALIKAKIISIKFHSELSDSNSIVVGSSYKVRLKVEDVLEGYLGKNKINVLLTASHEESFKVKKYIYLLLKKDRDQLVALQWNQVREVVCFSNDDIEEYSLSGDFFIDDKYSKTRCIDVAPYK